MEMLPMGDLSAEPSMEEILSSIKRIIAEEGDTTPARQRRQQRAPAPPPSPAEQAEADEVLELKDAVPVSAPPPVQPRSAPTSQTASKAQPIPQNPPTQPSPAAGEPAAAAILSQRAAESTRGSLESLSRLLVKPEPESDGTLEGLVREMLRPMLREWFDANLPEMVQAMVAREIAKITRQQG